MDAKADRNEGATVPACMADDGQTGCAPPPGYPFPNCSAILEMRVQECHEPSPQVVRPE